MIGTAPSSFPLLPLFAGLLVFLWFLGVFVLFYTTIAGQTARAACTVQVSYWGQILKLVQIVLARAAAP